MTMPNSASSGDRRALVTPVDISCVDEMTCQDHKLAPAKGLHSIRMLFRVLAGMLGLVMVMQVVSGLTGTVDISYGVLIAEAMRLVVYAAVLWGVGDLSELFIKTHCDLRAIRILMAHQAPDVGNTPAVQGGSRPAGEGSGPGDERR
jgi:hypothetical protein